MTKYRLSFPFTELTGKVKNNGGVYFRRTGGIGVLQGGMPKEDIVSAEQAFVRGVFTESMAAWSVLPDAKKRLWNDWADANPTIDRGIEVMVPGVDRYREIWQVATNGRQTPPDDPPSVKPTLTLDGQRQFFWQPGYPRYHTSAYLSPPVDLNHWIQWGVSPSNPSEAAPYRPENVLLGNRVSQSGSIKQESAPPYENFFMYDWSRVWVVGEYVWIRYKMYSSDWWPGAEQVFQDIVQE